MNTLANFLLSSTKNLFFTGKGGVGKTSLACASALWLARQGRSVLIVSTDPASNLDEVLEVEVRDGATPVPGVPGLWALNIDPERAAKSYRERIVGPYREVFPEAVIRSMEEQLSGACTVEIAAFDEFTKVLGNSGAIADYDHIIFDTAPTGHTLRLLKLPAAWTGFIDTNTTGTSCLGPLAGLQSQKELYESSLRALADSRLTTLILVSRPETSALVEAERTRKELEALGMRNQRLALNGVFTAEDRSDKLALALELRGQGTIQAMAPALSSLPRIEVPLLPFPLNGIENLAALSGEDFQNERRGVTRIPRPPHALPPLSVLIDELERMGRRVVMTMGKGGVGKTTIAAAIAVELARRGHRVRLSTTDPAAHITAAIGAQVGGLEVGRIDPVAETQRYTMEVQSKAAPHLDAKGRALLEEDLRSPCTEEIAVFRAFAETVAHGDAGFVVLDTAPTGHTLLLLDAAEAYHRDILRTTSDMPEAVRNLLPRLRDPEFTRVLLLTLPEATPVHEAARLQDDLLRAGITPFAWVINQGFWGTSFQDPLLVERGLREVPYIAEVRDKLARRLAFIPWQPELPVGAMALRAIIEASVSPSPFETAPASVTTGTFASGG